VASSSFGCNPADNFHIFGERERESHRERERERERERGAV